MSDPELTTDDVRDVVVDHLYETPERAAEAFDRWLAEVERAAAAKAYEQGRLDERHDCNRYTEYQQGLITGEQYQRDARSRNPYRREETE